MNENILRDLQSMQDKKYKTFHAKLIPNLKEEVIGVRLPLIRAYAKKIKSTETAAAFLHDLPHKYQEENLLHAFLIGEEKDFSKAITLAEAFLPYVNNWAVCDSFKVKAFKKEKEQLLPYIKKWSKSPHTYTVRFSILQLMSYFLDEAFKTEYLALVSNIKSNEYYIQMAQAWYFATAIAKQEKEALKYIEEKKLETVVLNKTIQKAIESFRVSDETKQYLRSLRIN